MEISGGELELALEKEFNDGADVDDILVCSWGYDQTNVDYYKVVRRTKASAWIVPIGQKMVPGSEGFMSETVLPDPDKILGHEFQPFEDEPDVDRCVRCFKHAREHGPRLHRVRLYNGEAVLRMTSYSSAFPWNGTPDYASHYA